MNLRVYGDEVLKQKAAPVGALTEELKVFADALIEAMFAFDGLGLAAPQVGRSIRMIALAVPRPADKQEDGSPAPQLQLSQGEMELLPKMPMVILNPEIIEYGKETSKSEEGCLSLPDIYAPVTRPATITVKGEILGGAPFVLTCGGLLARALQHEIDHLDGTVFVERLSPEDYLRVKSKVEKLLKHGKRKGFLRTLADLAKK